MEKENFNIKKTCSFYVSEYHLVTMLLPYIKEKIDNNGAISTFLENNLSEKMEKLVNGTNLNKKDKEEIITLNWKNINPYKYKNVEKELETINKEKNINIIVSGSMQYIDAVNANVERWAKKNNINIVINNCYEVSNFNKNIKEILDKHDKILNTSGEQEIENIFEGYKRPLKDIINK